MNITLCENCAPRIFLPSFCCRKKKPKKKDDTVTFLPLSENINLADYFDDVRNGVAIIVSYDSNYPVIVRTTCTGNYNPKIFRKPLSKADGKKLHILHHILPPALAKAIEELEMVVREKGAYNGFVAEIDDVSYLIAGYPIVDMLSTSGKVISVLITKSPNTLTESVKNLFRK